MVSWWEKWASIAQHPVFPPASGTLGSDRVVTPEVESHILWEMSISSCSKWTMCYSKFYSVETYQAFERLTGRSKAAPRSACAWTFTHTHKKLISRLAKRRNVSQQQAVPWPLQHERCVCPFASNACLRRILFVYMYTRLLCREKLSTYSARTWTSWLDAKEAPTLAIPSRWITRAKTHCAAPIFCSCM